MLLLLIIATLTGIVTCQDGVPAVAFSAGLTHNVTLQHTGTIVFDRIFTNIGLGYNSLSGNFNCPVAGIYVFQFRALSHIDKSAWLELYHNANYIVSAYGHTASDYASTGNSVILRLAKGDQVSIMSVDISYGAGTTIYGRPDEVYSTFTGYLIAAVYEETIPVYIKSEDIPNGGTTIYGRPDEVYSTFSGYLITVYEETVPVEI